MTKESKVLVDTFKQSIEKVRQTKDQTRRLNMTSFGTAPGSFSKEQMNQQDKRKVLEHFVENDNALSLLLDFISSKHLQRPAGMMAGTNNML